MDHSNAAGSATSALIIAGCLLGLFLIVRLRRQQARTAGVPYMDGWRKFVLVSAVAAGLLYAAVVTTAVLAGW